MARSNLRCPSRQRNRTGSIYLDDGHTFAYQHGEFLRQDFSCQIEKNSVTVELAERKGTFTPWWKTIEVVVYDWPAAKANFTLAGSPTALKSSYDPAAHALHVTVPESNAKQELRISR